MAYFCTRQGWFLGILVLIICKLPILAEVTFEHDIVDSQEEGHVAVCDIDEDGFNDIVSAKDGSGIAWYLYPKWDKYWVVQNFQYRSDDIAVADVDNDRDFDVIGVENDNGTAYWFENPKPSSDPTSGTWSRHALGNTGVGYCKDIEIADFNHDTKIDVVIRGEQSTVLFVQETPLTWAKSKIIRHPQKEGMRLGDLDKDGDLDIVLNGFWLETPSDLINGTYDQHNIDSLWYTQTSGGWWDNNAMTFVADINGDQLLDVLHSHSGTEGFPVAWYEATDPKGAWTKHTIDPQVDYCQSLQVGDVDKDGFSDVMVAEVYGYTDPAEIIVFYNIHGDGRNWEKQVVSGTGNYNAVLADIDNDHDLDIVGERSWQAPPVEVWRNRQESASSRTIYGLSIIPIPKRYPKTHGFDVFGREFSWHGRSRIGACAVFLLPHGFMEAKQPARVIQR